MPKTIDFIEYKQLLEVGRPLLSVETSEVICGDYDQGVKNAAELLAYQGHSVVAAVVQLGSVMDDLSTAVNMLSRYPWVPNKVSREDHLELIWFLFQNLCYKFKEKLKLVYNSQKILSINLKKETPSWLKSELKIVEKQLAAEIRSRGNSVHSWNEVTRPVHFVGMVAAFSNARELGETIDLPDGYFDVKGHFRDARYELKMRANEVIAHCEASFRRVLTVHSPTPLVSVARIIEIIDLLNQGKKNL